MLKGQWTSSFDKKAAQKELIWKLQQEKKDLHFVYWTGRCEGRGGGVGGQGLN